METLSPFPPLPPSPGLFKKSSNSPPERVPRNLILKLTVEEMRYKRYPVFGVNKDVPLDLFGKCHQFLFLSREIQIAHFNPEFLFISRNYPDRCIENRKIKRMKRSIKASAVTYHAVIEKAVTFEKLFHGHPFISFPFAKTKAAGIKPPRKHTLRFMRITKRLSVLSEISKVSRVVRYYKPILFELDYLHCTRRKGAFIHK